jgi:hypothetical protein
MSTGKHLFKQREATRLAKAAIAAGLKVCGLKVDEHGDLVVLTGEDEASAGPRQDPLDRVLDHAPRKKRSA